MNRILSKSGCKFCDAAIVLMDANDIIYEEFKLDHDFTRDEFLKMIPENIEPTFPQIWLEGVYVGGYTQLVDHIART